MRLGISQFGLSPRILSPDFATGITHTGVAEGQNRTVDTSLFRASAI
jgi:hypothetical protein